MLIVNSKEVVVKVPGKVLISGEHAVVYGKPALAASIDKGIIVGIKTTKDKIENNLIAKAIEVAGGNGMDLGLRIESDLPIGCGLGSSAALSAAVIKAVRVFLGKPVLNDELFDLTMECEKMAHGNPSGVDPAAVIYRGLIYFIKGQPIKRFVIKKSTQLLLVNSGKPVESTKEMVELAAAKDKNVMNKIGQITNEIKVALENGDNIEALLNQNGELLEELGVVGKKAKSLSNKLRSMGCGVKVTGAGGIKSGSGMLMVYHNDLSTIVSFLNQKKLDYFNVSIGG